MFIVRLAAHGSCGLCCWITALAIGGPLVRTAEAMGMEGVAPSTTAIGTTAVAVRGPPAWGVAMWGWPGPLTWPEWGGPL
mmetsp:Transcript_69824/g.130452  ORF Transcript_69824/g.130452 Transcript_69824/m.130452 type:complete len:80 (+) Transcript_69824:504-743(+)